MPLRRPPLTLVLFNLTIVGFLILPLAYLIIRAATDPQDAWAYITQERTLQVLWNSIKLAFAVGITSAIVGVPLAWLTVRTDLKGSRLWTVLCTVPLVMPSYVGAFALLSAFGPKGIVQGWLETFGVERLPDIRGFFGAWISITLFAFPYVFLSVRTGLRGIDPQLEAASRVLGKNGWQTFWRVTFPQLIPSLTAGVLLTMLYALSDFGVVAFMRFNAFTRVIFIQNTQSFRPARVAMLSLELILLAVILVMLSRWLERNNNIYLRKSSRHASVIELGHWQWVAQAFCGLIVLLSLIAPVGIVVYWLINGLQHGQELNGVLIPLQRSMRVSGAAAFVAGAISIPLVLMQVRYPGRMSRWMNIGSTVGFALPGIVVAIALVYFATRYAINLYQTLPLLILAYILRFLPQMTNPIRASWLQINPHIEESAMTLGKNRWQVFASVTLPLIRSGWITGMALVFLTVMKELPVTLILSPIEFSTLATEIWSSTQEAFYARAAAPALVLILVSALSLFYILETDD